MSAIKVLKFICCLREEKAEGKTIQPKSRRKVNLEDATKSGSNTEVVLDAEFKKIVNELKKTESFNEICNQSSKSPEQIIKLEKSLRKELSKLKEMKKHKDHKIKNYKNEKELKSASQTILRQHINELKRQKDFNSFLSKTNIGEIDEIASISDSESSSSCNNGKRCIMRNESCQVIRNGGIKNFDINKAFMILSPQQIIKKRSTSSFFKSTCSETNTKDKKSSEENIQSIDYSQDPIMNNLSKVQSIGRERSYSNNDEPNRVSRDFSIINLGSINDRSSRAYTPQ